MTSAADPSAQRALLEQALLEIRRLRDAAQQSEQRQHAPVAIIGMACRLPGGVTDPPSFWRLLADGVDAVGAVPPERWDADSFYDPDPDAPGKISTREGGFLRGPIDGFDPQFFGIAPREVLGMDPQQRLLLEVCWEALEQAGQTPEQVSGSQTGIFMGQVLDEYAQERMYLDDPARIDAYSSLGMLRSLSAGRLAYFLGTHGPAIQLDSACSSSLVAVHLACQSLRSGESSLALAGGVNLMLSPQLMMGLCRLHALSPAGRCKVFSADADGYGRGEGCGVLVLKRLDDALRDGDPVLATIYGSAVNQDGRSQGQTVPNGAAQAEVIRSALADARVAPGAVQYVETHGTGTPVGDPVEARVLGQVLGAGRPADRPLVIGSVKTNIGHLESAAGVAALIKVVLALRHATIPPHLHFERPSASIPWDELPLRVPTAPLPWPAEDGPRLAGVSAFGMSGTNAHVVLGDPPRPAPASAEVARPAHLVTLSAQSEPALQELVGRYLAFLEAHPDTDLAAIGATSTLGRAHFAQRLALCATSTEHLRQQLGRAAARAEHAGVAWGRAEGPPPSQVAFLFSGQGAQYPDMGRELYTTQPVFRAALDRCAALLAPALERPLTAVLYPADEADRSLIHQTAYAQPALFALEYALAELWQSWGLRPTAVMGHSVGEYAAACLAGVFSLEDGLKLTAARGRLMQALPPRGSMAVVFAERERVEAALAPYAAEVSIAAVNSPSQIAISGVTEAVQAICAGFAEQGVKTRPMTVSHAFHSPLMEPILEEFGRIAREVVYALPRIEVISNLTGRSVGGRIATADYWVEHIRQPVECMAGLATLREQGCRVYLEIGPQPVLVGLGRQQSADPGALWLASMRANESDWGCLLGSLGQLYCGGVPVAWREVQRGFASRRIALPTYPFQRQSYWKELRPVAQHALPAGRAAGHPLLGARLDLPGSEQIRYSAALGARRPEFLGDHRVRGAAIFPASGYVELCLAAAAAALDTARLALDDLAILRPLALPEAQPSQVQVVLTPGGAGSWGAQIFCRDAAGAEWQLHATASVSAAAEEPLARADLAALQAGGQALPADEHYRRCAQQGLDYGPAFQAVRQLWLRDGSVLAALELEGAAQTDAYLLHPALLDAAFQALAAVQIEQHSGDTYLPVGLTGLRLYRRAGRALWAEARVYAPTGPGAATLKADLLLYDADGAPVATVEELTLRRTDPAALQAPAGEQRPLYRLDWQRRDLPQARPPAGPGTWLVFADRQGLGAQVRGLLETAGQRCVLVAPGAQFERIEPELFQISPSADADFRRLLHEALPASAPPCRGALFLWPLDDDAPAADDGQELVELQERGSAGALRLVQALPALAGAPPQLWLVTRGTQQLAAAPGASVRPLHAPLWGLGRVIALEHPELRCARVDLAPEPAADEARLLFALLSAETDEDQLALRGGQVYAPRLAPLPDSAAEPAYQLQIRQYGVLDDLALRPTARRAPGPGEIEIRVAAVGLNLRDVLHALGMLPDTAAALPFGFECAGLVTAVGPEAAGFAVGDPVISGLTAGAMASFITMPAARCAPLPAGMSFAEAATLPLAFLTAFYGLQHLARLKRGERVLIHAAAGGVGQAAVQLALHAGAEVWATAHPDKWAFLRAQGVRHVLNSRTLEFADQIREATGGQGVDVVLNSLNGAFIDQSFAALCDGGRFVEIGKLGIWDQARVEALGRGIAYHHFDMSSVSQEQPELIGALFRQVLDLIAAGALRPLPQRTFAMSQAAEAFRTMAQAQHIGKIVLTWPPEQLARPLAVRPDASYLISGGLGFIGLQIARWIVARGGRHLALLARSQPSRAALDQIALLEQAGARVLVLQADVARADELRRALDQIGAHLPPLRGVVHAAGVLEDGTLQQQRWPQFQRVLEPKVAGAWNLHRLTRDLPLDLFVLCSSLAGLLGSAGQANYAAANAFLDALACQRRAEGRAGVSLAWGLWEGGMGAALSAQDRARLSAQGVQALTAERALALLEQAIQHPDAQIGVLPVAWATFLRQFARTPPLLRQLVPQAGPRPQQQAAQRSLLEQLEDTPPEERREVLLAHVRGQVAGILGFPSPDEVAVGQELVRLGIDSLTGVELSNRLKISTGLPLASTLIFDCPTVEQIAAHLERLLLPQPSPAAPGVSGPDGAQEIVDMSEDEAAVLLLEELRRLGQ